MQFSAVAEEQMPDLESNTFLNHARRALYRLREFKDERLRSLRPWREFAGPGHFSLPGFSEVLGRIGHNTSYFRSNYLLIVFCLTIYYLVTNVMFLLAMIICGFAWYMFKHRASESCNLGTTELSSMQMHVILAVGTLIVFYITSGSGIICWLLFMACSIIFVHGSLHDADGVFDGYQSVTPNGPNVPPTSYYPTTVFSNPAGSSCSSTPFNL